ncbi:MAG TPA: carboxypeptidase-like regulatory domain-containing protein [Thermoanaerobaculia bacterium]|nr:carboxypeptidase-like regulatory domain-containing protein [Thermoanaerobaculia bacterium]
MILAALTLHAAITGALYTPDGKPVANARVVAQRIESPEDQNARLVSGKLERKVAAMSTTDASGTFTLDTKSSGVFEVNVAADAFAPHRQLALADDAGLGIALTRVANRTGRVTANGKPVANAIVALREQQRGPVLLTVRTSDDGAFSVPDPRGWAASIAVLHPDFAPIEKTMDQIPPRGAIELAITPGMSVTGKVLAADGTRITNAILTADGWPAGKTREDGTFVLPHVREDIDVIKAIAPGAHGVAPRAKDIVIRIAQSRTITGNVRDVNRQPIIGAVIAAWADGNLGITVTDEQGTYRLEHCDAQQYQVNAYATADLTFNDMGRVNLKQWNARQDFTATANSFLRGVVIDARKKPIAGARVITSEGETTTPTYAISKMEESATVLTGPDGKFRLATGDDKPVIIAMRAGYAAAVSEPIDLTKGYPRTPIMITLPDGIEVRGSVTDRDHQPIAGAAILAVENPGGAVPFPLDALIAAGMLEAMFVSDEHGQFSIKLNRAPHDLLIWKEGFVPFRRAGMSPDGRAIDAVLERGVAIRGRLARKSGPLPTEGGVSAIGDDGTGRFVEIGPDATFEINSIPPGEYVIEFDRANSARRKVRAPADNVVIELEPLSTIRGRVLDKATSEPIQKYRVRAGETYASVEDRTSFTLDVAPGPAQLDVMAEGYLGETIDVTVVEGKPTEVTVSLNRGRTVRGRVTSSNGGALGDASVQLQTEEGRQQSTSTDEDGEYELNELPREPVTLVVQHSGFITKRVNISDRDDRADVMLSSGRKVTGRVVTTSGEAIAEAYVSATSPAHEADSQTIATGNDGSFTLAGLGDARYTFIAMRRGYQSGKLEDVDVTSAAQIVITLTSSEEVAAGTIHGTVEGFQKSGMFYGVVNATSENASSQTGMINRDGTYRVENVAAGAVRVQAAGNGFSGELTSSEAHVTLPPGGDVVVDLRFRTDIKISGVVTEDGEPARNRVVKFDGENNANATTDINGAYELIGVVPGTYNVTVVSQRGVYTTSFEVTGSATFDIRIDSSRIDGRVVDEEGAPVSGALVAINDRKVTTDASGSFSISLPAGKHLVKATKSGYADASVETEAGGAPVTITLTRANELRVRIVDARDNTTLGGYVVAIGSNGATIANANGTRPDGTNRLAIPAGSYRVAASADGYATQSVRVNAPSADEVRVPLTPGGKLIIHTTKANAVVAKLVAPAGEEYVQCHCNGVSAIKIEGSRGVVEHVAPSRYTLQLLDANAKVIASTTVEIVEGRALTAEM